MKQFEELYNEISNNEELNNIWNKVKEEDKKIKKITLPIHIVVTIIILMIMIKLVGFKIISLPIIGFALLMANIMVLAFGACFKKEQGKYDSIFKKAVIEKLINNFYDNVEYFPQKQMPKRIYDEEKYEYYNRYYSDDYIEAKINNNYDISMAEVKTVEQKTERDRDGHTRTRNITKFHGIFAKVVIDKSIEGQLKIKRNGSFAFGKDRLEMDSSEFEKYFDVSATNKIIGMQLLTADVMEELIEFINKTNIRYDIVIKNDNIYIRFHSGAMFETGSLKKGPIDKEMVQKYFYMLNFTYNLSNKIIKLINETEI